jgi:hypothetical protein
MVVATYPASALGISGAVARRMTASGEHERTVEDSALNQIVYGTLEVKAASLFRCNLADYYYGFSSTNSLDRQFYYYSESHINLYGTVASSDLRYDRFWLAHHVLGTRQLLLG